MSSFHPTARHAAAVLALACAPTWAAHLTGLVTDAAGQPVAGALVVASSETEVKNADGATHRWITASDAAGRFAFDGFPAGHCHVTATADGGRAGLAATPCLAASADAALEAAIMLQPQPAHVSGRVLRTPKAVSSPDDVALFARVPTSEDDLVLVVYGTRITGDTWAVDLPAGAWMAKAVTPHGESRTAHFALPARQAPIELKLASVQGSHPELTRELHAMAAKDQDIRNKMIASGGDDAKSDAAMARVDSANLARLKQIVHQHGWPTADLVGIAGMGDFWLLAQHSPPGFIAQALPHLKAAADRGEVDWSALALTIDRDLVYHQRPQVYGSQGTFKDGHFVLDDVQDPEHLDERRAQVGLGPIADYKSSIEKAYRQPGPAN